MQNSELGTIVEEKLRNVLDVMKRNGFALSQKIDVAIDENLTFMGYTSRQWQKHTIVVSGFAVRSPMLEGLLAHELSHVYRNVTNHPSHNEKIITSTAASFAQLHGLCENYQYEILHQVINHIQDLSADDIAVKVLAAGQNNTAALEMLGEFFLGWIKEEPVKSGSRQMNAWNNAGILLNNCFAVSNIQRRKSESYYEKAESRDEEFLREVNPRARSSFLYFNEFMVNLKEDVTEDEFEEHLGEYLEHLWAVAEYI